jgi:hypothetical protein
MTSTSEATIKRLSDGKYAVIRDGEILYSGFAGPGHAAMWAARQNIYKPKGKPRRWPVIPNNLEDESIKPLPLLARMSGGGYPRFLREAKEGLYGELYKLGNGYGLKYGDWKRGMAARVIK